ncbi:MAG: LysR family transcriptional regulator [Spirochaetaceae bacterium]|nr:LysR family transcriptional regulator [Spirochaetaceae bacterium]
MTEAARAVGLTQPAVTQHLAALEEGYGVVLAERRGRRLVPTAAGSALFAYGERIEAVYRETARAVGEAAGLERYEIGATLTVAEYLMPEVLAALRRSRPGLELRLRAANTEAVAAGVRRGELALGLVEGPFDPKGLEAEVLGQDRLVAVAAPGTSLSGRRFEARDFAGLPLLVRERGSGTRSVFEAWLSGRGVDPAALVPAMEIGSIGTIKSLVERGLGVSVLSELAVAAELAAGRLVGLHVEGLPVKRDIVLLRPAGSRGLFAGCFAPVVAELLRGPSPPGALAGAPFQG